MFSIKKVKITTVFIAVSFMIFEMYSIMLFQLNDNPSVIDLYRWNGSSVLTKITAADESPIQDVSIMDPVGIIDSMDNPNYVDIITSDDIRERIVNNTITIKNKYITKDATPRKSPAVTVEEEEKIVNILLVGIDSRRNDFKDARADTIIIVSINKTLKEIKLISILRDTYVNIPHHKNNRINATYNFGGPDLLQQTINNNFNLSLDKYIVIDFKGFQNVVDLLGGVDVDLKKYEVAAANKSILGIGGNRKDFIHQSGITHLNGNQTLAYCRIRKVGSDDYERTARQRNIIKLIINKAKIMPSTDYPKLITHIYPYVKTNITNKESLKLIYDHYNVHDWKIDTLQIPTKESGKEKVINSMWVVEPDLVQCTAYIKEFISGP